MNNSENNLRYCITSTDVYRTNITMNIIANITFSCIYLEQCFKRKCSSVVMLNEGEISALNRQIL